MVKLCSNLVLSAKKMKNGETMLNLVGNYVRNSK